MEPRGQEDATPAETGDVSPAQADTGDLATAAGDAYVQVPTSEDEVSPAASGGNGEWVKQWDERVGEFYFSNIHTRATSWEQPPDYVDTTAGTASGDRKKRHEEADDVDEQDSQDECDGGMRIINSHDVASVKTQRVYRGHSPRNKLEVQQQWIKQFDPSSQQVYYYNIGTSESQWDQPDDFVEGVQDAKTEGVVKIQSLYRSKKARDQVKDRMVESNGGESGSVVDEVDSGDVQLEGGRMSDNDNNGKGSRHEAALSIQCAFRKHSAVKTAESKRGDLRDLTCTDTINQKIGDLMRAMDEIQLEINARQLVSAAEMEEFPHLCELVASWTNSFDALKDRILGLPYQADQIQKMEVTSEKTANAKHLHESLAETRSECLSLLRSIFLMNTYFVDLDVKRINGANATFRKWKSHELCALADPRIVKIVQPDDLQDVFTLVERTLRRAMGLTDFTSGATTAAGKRYEEWHIEVIAALESVTQMEQRLQHKIHLLHMFRAGQAERKEVALMEIEDFTSSQREAVSKERARQADKYAKFLEECRGSWESGLEKRLDDAQEAIAHEKAEHEALTRKLEIVEKMRKRDHHRRATMKLSIWEAVREGLPVEILRTMVFAEMQKARRLGYDFLLRSARSDHGESLIQIACWWGHEVRFTIVLFDTSFCIEFARTRRLFFIST